MQISTQLAWCREYRYSRFRQALKSCAKPNSELLYMKSLKSGTVRSDWMRQKSKDWLLPSFWTTLERLGFRNGTCHEPWQCKCYVKFACLKQKVILVDLELLLIYLVRLSETGVSLCSLCGCSFLRLFHGYGLHNVDSVSIEAASYKLKSWLRNCLYLKQ